MNNIFKKIFRTIIASVIIFCIALVIEFILNIIEFFCPVLSWIIVIGIILFAGYFFGNGFNSN